MVPTVVVQVWSSDRYEWVIVGKWATVWEARAQAAKWTLRTRIIPIKNTGMEG